MMLQKITTFLRLGGDDGIRRGIGILIFLAYLMDNKKKRKSDRNEIQ